MAEYTFKLATVSPTITYAPTPVVDVGSNSLECLVSKQTSPQHENLTGGTYEYSSQVPGLPWISSVDLNTAPLWLVFASASYGGGPLQFGGAAVCDIGLMSNRGGANPPNSDRVYLGGEGSGILGITPESSRSNIIAGCFLWTPDGTDLEFRMRTPTGTPRTTFYSGMSITCLPVDIAPTNNKRLHYFPPGGDLFGNQMVLTGATPIVVPSGTAFAPILTVNQTLTAGNYFVVASMHGDTAVNNALQMQFLIDGTVQMVPVNRMINDVRDDIPFFYSSVHSFTAGNHLFELQGGHVSGASSKTFRSARIWMINLNNFERWSHVGEYAPLAFGNIQFPNWNTATDIQTSITPFSTSGEFLLSVGTSIVDRTLQSGSMSRILNASTGLPAHEHSAVAQVVPGGNDVCCLANIGCELANTQTTYQLQHCGSQGLPASDIDVRCRDLTVIGLTKKPGAAPPSVSIIINDSCTSSEFQSTPTSEIGAKTVLDSCSTADFLNFVGGSPVGIPNTHPRLFLTPAYLTILRNQAGYDDNGNIIGPPSPDYVEFLSDLNTASPSIFSLWPHVLKWKITQAPADLATARSKIATAFNTDVGFLGGTTSGALQNSGLTSGRWVRQACLFYDWLYSELTPAEKTMMQEYIMGIVYATLNNSGKGTPQVIYNPLDETWSQNDPSNNYFANFHHNSVYAGVTLYHDVWPNNTSPSFAWPNPGSGQNVRAFWLPYKKGQAGGATYTDVWQYAKDRTNNLALPVWDKDIPGGIVGGGWHEGGWYRPMWAVMECFRVMEMVAGYVPTTTMIDFRDYAEYIFRSTMPRHKRQPETGDSGNASKRKYVGPQDRILMLHLAQKYRNETLGQYAKFWTKNINTSCNFPDQTDRQWDGFDFLLVDDTISQSDYRGVIPKYWYSPCNGMVISKRGWDDDSSLAIISSLDRIQIHGHASQNEIMVFTGRTTGDDDGWMLGPRCAYGSSGENQQGSWESKQHCTYELGGFQQRASKTQANPVPEDILPSGHIDKTSHIEDLYVYAQGNASDAYRQGVTGFSQSGHPLDSINDVFLREFVDLPSLGITVIYDRIRLRQNTPRGNPVTQTVVGHFHYPKPQPTVVGEVATLAIGTAKLYRKHLLPTNLAATTTWLDEATEGVNAHSFDEVINFPVVNRYVRYMAAVEMETNASPGVSPIFPWDSGQLWYEGATIDKGGTRYHVGFAINETGAEPANPFMYFVTKQNNNDRHIITGLAPLQRYFLTEDVDPIEPTRRRYTATKGQIGVQSDEAGVLTFTPAMLPDQTTAFIQVNDGCTEVDGPSRVVADQFITVVDSCTNVENRLLSSESVATIHVNDSCNTADTPILVGSIGSVGGAVFDSCGSRETLIMVADTIPTTPVFAWKEKIIKVNSSPMFPAADRSSSFFGDEPSSGSLFDKLADPNDATFVYTFGAQATNAYMDFGLTPPGDFVGGIKLIQPVIRILSCELAASVSAQIEFAISGLGITITAQTARIKQLFNTAETTDIVFDPIPVNIKSAQFPAMGMNIAVSGFPIGVGFLLKISRAYINVLSATSSEKVIQ